jgi:hypothetical protein
MNVNRIALAIAGLILPAALLPAQTPVPHVRTICVKVAPGKAAEYNAYLRDISVKLLRARVDDGELVGADVLRSVEPVGTSARCDYLLVWEYNGFPGEMNTADRTNALLKKLGMKMTAAELAAKRDSLSTLVGMEIWRNVDMVPADEAKGGYLRLNLYKTKPGKVQAWVDSETKEWKPIVEAYTKDGNVTGWSAWRMLAPAGDTQAYDAATADYFPDWAAAGRGLPLTQLWGKVHPNTSIPEWQGRMGAIRTRPAVELYQIAEIVAPKK